LQAFTGEVLVRDVTAATVASFASELPVGLNTRRKTIRYLRAVWTHAIADGVAAEQVFHATPASHVATDRSEVYVTAEEAMAAGSSLADRWPLLLALTRLCGLRLGEAQRVRPADLDLEGRLLTVRHDGPVTTKRRRRVVPLSDRAIMELTGPWLFDDSRLCAGLAWPHRRLKALTAGRWTFQDCRASCETDWLRAGNAVGDVCAWLGHSTAVAVKHYHRPTLELKEAQA